MASGRGNPNPNQFLWRLVEVEGLCNDALGHASIGHEHEESDEQEHLEDEHEPWALLTYCRLSPEKRLEQ